MSYIVAIVGAIMAALIEYQFRTRPGWLDLWWFTLPGALLINWCVWYLVKADGLIGGFVIFSFAAMLCRFSLTMYLGEDIAAKLWVAFSLVLAANFVKILG